MLKLFNHFILKFSFLSLSLYFIEQNKQNHDDIHYNATHNNNYALVLAKGGKRGDHYCQGYGFSQ